MTKHVRFGSSSAHLDINCQAKKFYLGERQPPDVTSPAAARGTLLHTFAQTAINENCPPSAVDGYDDLPLDDQQALTSALNDGNEILDRHDIKEFVTEEFMAPPNRPEIGGTPDLIGISANGCTALILDWKYGRVPVENFDQHLFLAMCWRRDKKYNDMLTGVITFVMVVVQPGYAPREAVYSWDQVREWEQKYLHAIDNPTETGVLGEWCQYCSAARYCDEKRRSVVSFINHDPTDAQELGAAMDLIPAMKQHIKMLEGATFQDLLNNKPVPGWKLVLKRAKSSWINPAEVLAFLKNKRSITRKDYLNETLMSPTQVKKRTDVDLETFITRASTGSTLAPESDPRDAIVQLSVIPAALDRLFK